jgi:hypothetical protein
LTTFPRAWTHFEASRIPRQGHCRARERLRIWGVATICYTLGVRVPWNTARYDKQRVK